MLVFTQKRLIKGLRQNSASVERGENSKFGILICGRRVGSLDKWIRLLFIGEAFLGGRLAQRLAQRLYTPLVAGSNPASPTIFQLENGDSI